jgi:hypothetical protein
MNTGLAQMTNHGALVARRAAKALATTTILILAGWPGSVSADEVTETLVNLTANTIITREVSLKEVGLREPIILNSSDARREIFLPVPPGVPISDATLQLDARYLRGEGGRTTLVISLDGYPVSARLFNQPDGDASLAIGVDGAPRLSGFVRLGAAWSSIVSERACSDERTSGNILEISPTTRLSYRYDSATVRDLASAWMSLPSTVTIAIPSQSATRETYDAAWRIGLALQRGGKQVAFRALPSVGDEIDLAEISVPESLRAIPTFGKLAGAGRRTIETPAELGALLLLNVVRAQVAIANREMQSKLDAALAALDQEISVSAPGAKVAFTQWRAQAMSIASEPLAAGSVHLLRLAGHPLIAVAEDAGAKAAGLFDELWTRVATSRSVVISNVNNAIGPNSAVSLSRLGGGAFSFDVLERGEWSANFSLGDLATDGRVPSKLELDVSAAPGASTTLPVASVFINDILLGAKRLDANGQPERITVSVPSYALKPQNVLRVSFQRQAAGEHCRETPQAYPVAILPTSRLLLDMAPVADDFAGVVPPLAGSATLIVADRWLGDAPATLAATITLANASGLSPVRASFTVGSAPIKPSGPFLSLDVPVDGISPKTKVEGNRLIIAGQDSTNLLDITGLENLGTISVARSGDIAGLAYNTVGTSPLAPEGPITLSDGDVAIFGSKGVLAELDTRSPFGVRAASDDRKTWFQELWNKVAWGGSAAASGLFLLLLARAWHVRRRNSGGSH